MAYPISPVRAWTIILASNRTGQPYVNYMTKSEIATCNKIIMAAMPVEWNIPLLLKTWSRRDDICIDDPENINKLRAVILLTQKSLADFIHDNTVEDVECWEDKYPELDSLRTWLQEFEE